MNAAMRRFIVGVTLGVACSVALPAVLLPHLMDLTHITEWLLSMAAIGVLGIIGIGLWSHRRLQPVKATGQLKGAVHDIPFALAQAVLGFAVLVGVSSILVLWGVGHRLSLATSAGVIAYLLSALPVLGVYLFSRRRLSTLTALTPHASYPKGRRQSLRLRVLLAFQLPLVVSATGIVLVAHADNAAYHQAVNVYHQDQRLRTYDLIQTQLSTSKARKAMADAVGHHIPFQVGDAISLPAVPYSLRWSMLVVLGLVVLLSAYVGRWLSRDVTADISAIRNALHRLTKEDRRIVTPAGVAMRETAEVVDAFRAALIGFETQHSRMQAARADRERAERSKARFLAHLSHELKSPLNSILGFSELLLAELDGPVDDQQREYLSVIWRSGDALLRFIIGVLELARLEGTGSLDEPHSPPPIKAADIVHALEDIARVDPLGAVVLRINAEGSDTSNWPTSPIDPSQTARAMVLAAGVLLDTMISGEVHIGLSHESGALVLELQAHPKEVDATDLKQLVAAWQGWLQSPGDSGGRASIIPLRLLDRLAEVGNCRFDLLATSDWPRIRLRLPAA